MPPETSIRVVLPVALRSATAVRMSGCVNSSSMITSGRAASAARKSSSVSTSTSTGTPGTCRARSGHGRGDAAGGDDVVLLDEHHVVQAEADDCGRPRSARRTSGPGADPGRVLRVSRIRQEVPATAATYSRVTVAVPDRVCTKFNAQRSPVRMARAGPCISQITALAANSVAVMALPLDVNRGVQLPESLRQPGAATKHHVLARDEGGMGHRAGGTSAAVHITRADVFGQRAGDLIMNVRWLLHGRFEE